MKIMKILGNIIAVPVMAGAVAAGIVCAGAFIVAAGLGTAAMSLLGQGKPKEEKDEEGHKVIDVTPVREEA